MREGEAVKVADL